MLAEHGLFGFVSLIALISVLAQLVLKSGRSYFGPVAAGMAAWVVLYMAVNAFRLVLPAFAIGLAVVLRDVSPNDLCLRLRAGLGRTPRA